MGAAKDTIQTEKNTLDFFHSHLKKSIKNQNLEITEVSEYYLVHLLVDFTLTHKALKLRGNDKRPLALIFQQAQSETILNKIKIFRELGDFSLTPAITNVREYRLVFVCAVFRYAGQSPERSTYRR